MRSEGPEYRCSVEADVVLRLSAGMARRIDCEAARRGTTASALVAGILEDALPTVPDSGADLPFEWIYEGDVQVADRLDEELKAGWATSIGSHS